MSRSLVSPKPLTGRKVLFMLVAFFGVVIAVNVLMAKLAIETLPGTEVDSAYSASLAYEDEIAAARDQNARNWKVDAHIQRGPDGGATLQVEARDNSGLPMTGLNFQGRFERPADRRADQAVALAEVASGVYRGTAVRDRARTMGPGARRRRGGTADVPVEEPRAVELGRPHHAGDARFFTLCEGPGLGPSAHRSRGRRRQLRRMHVEDRARAFGDTRRDAGPRQPDRSPRGAGMEATARSIPPASSIGWPNSDTRPIRSKPSARRRRKPSNRAVPAALSRRRRLRHHERHDAVGSGVVRQRRRHDPRAARFLPLAVGADRAAGGRLCRPAILSLGLSGAAHRQRQHGRSDQHRRHRWRSACRLSRPLHHAEHTYFDAAIMLLTFLLVGPLSRSEHAAARPARSPAIWPRSRPRPRPSSSRPTKSARCRWRRSIPATSCCCGRASAARSMARSSKGDPRSTRA